MRVWLTAAVVITGSLMVIALWLFTPDRPRAELESRYLAAPSDYVEVAGIRLHVRDSGPRDAPALILLHGFGSSLHTWEEWGRALAGRYRVIRFDLPGSGLTGPDPTGNYTDGRAMVILAALMDRLGVDRANLIGNSVGGRIAWRYAAENPSRVDRLVLISPDGFASRGFGYGVRPTVPASLRLLRYCLPLFMVRMSLKPAYGDPAALSDETVNRYRDLMLGPGVRDAMLDRLEQTILTDPEPVLRLISAPTLLLWGEKDAMIPVGNAAEYLRLVPGSVLAALPGLGHVPFEEAPARSLEPVRSFLDAGSGPRHQKPGEVRE